MKTPEHPVVTESDWDAFLNDTVTPRFPSGFTVSDARGQWREPDGGILRESSKVLEIVHAPAPADAARIQEIVRTYELRFQQESVLYVRQPCSLEGTSP